MLAQRPVESAHERLIGTEGGLVDVVNKIVQLLFISMLCGSYRGKRRELPGMADGENCVFIHFPRVLFNLSTSWFFFVRDIMFGSVKHRAHPHPLHQSHGLSTSWQRQCCSFMLLTPPSPATKTDKTGNERSKYSVSLQYCVLIPGGKLHCNPDRFVLL